MVVDQHEAHLPAGVLLVGGEPVPPDCLGEVLRDPGALSHIASRQYCTALGRASGRECLWSANRKTVKPSPARRNAEVLLNDPGAVVVHQRKAMPGPSLSQRPLPSSTHWGGGGVVWLASLP